MYIFIRQNKCDHLGRLFYVLSFIQFCARKLLLPIICLALKFIFNYRVFSTKLHAHQMFGSREFITIFRVAPKSICGPCNIQTMRATGKKHQERLDHFSLMSIESEPVPSPRGVFWGLSPPKQSSKPPKLKHETL